MTKKGKNFTVEKNAFSATLDPYYCIKLCSVADPDPGSGIGCLFDPGIRDGRKSAYGSGIRDEQPRSYFLQLRNHFFAFLGVKILKLFDEDPGWRHFGSGIRDGKKSDPGSGINNPDSQHWF